MVVEPLESPALVELEGGLVRRSRVHEGRVETTRPHPLERVVQQRARETFAATVGVHRETLDVTGATTRTRDGERIDAATRADASRPVRRGGPSDVGQAAGVVPPHRTERLAIEGGGCRVVAGPEPGDPVLAVSTRARHRRCDRREVDPEQHQRVDGVETRSEHGAGGVGEQCSGAQ